MYSLKKNTEAVLSEKAHDLHFLNLHLLDFY